MSQLEHTLGAGGGSVPIRAHLGAGVVSQLEHTLGAGVVSQLEHTLGAGVVSTPWGLGSVPIRAHLGGWG